MNKADVFFALVHAMLRSKYGSYDEIQYWEYVETAIHNSLMRLKKELGDAGYQQFS